MQKSEKRSILDISVVIPIYNEEGNIKILHSEICEVLDKITDYFEIIYVNDGSTDGSLDELRFLGDRVVIIDLNRNYGQTTAFDAGFKASCGNIIISMDGDGQNDPKDISLLIEKMKKEDLDVVTGWRKDRNDKKGICILTRMGRFFRNFLIKDGVHDSGCSFRVYSRKAVKSLDIGGEMHRYILALLKWKGFRIGELVVNHRPRLRGVSKYNYSKAIRGFIDLIYIWFIHKYFQRPLHLFGYMSFFSFFLGILSGFWSIYGKVALGLSLNRNGWFFITFFLMLSGIILFSFGIVIDLLIRNMFNSSCCEKRYYIRRVIRKEMQKL